MPKAISTQQTSLLVLPRRDPKPNRLAALFERRERLTRLRADVECLEREWEKDRDRILAEMAANEAALY
jgi:hypothetical protein